MAIQEQLEQLNTAIKAIETGAQEYRIGNRQLRRADLSVLYAERRRLESIMAQESDVPPDIFVARFDRR